MFAVIGVLDLRDGRAVHARGGSRNDYRPINGVAAGVIEAGDPRSLVRFYVEGCGIRQLYVADLDAIEGRTRQAAVVREIAAFGAPLWLDSGIASADDARLALLAGATRLIVGLETLPSYHALDSIGQEAGRDHVVFSLDVRDGQPVAAPQIAAQAVEYILAKAIDAGIDTTIVLDLARVGSAAGPDLDLVRRVRAAAPGMTVIAGGGVRGVDDLLRLEEAGCNGALVATALLTGQLTAKDIEALQT